MLDKMPGRLLAKKCAKSPEALYGYMMAHPGKKLFYLWAVNLDILLNGISIKVYIGIARIMRCTIEMQLYVKELNHFYLERECLWQKDFTWEGFGGSSADGDNSVVSFY